MVPCHLTASSGMNELPERTPWVGTGGRKWPPQRSGLSIRDAWWDPPAPAEAGTRRRPRKTTREDYAVGAGPGLGARRCGTASRRPAAAKPAGPAATARTSSPSMVPSPGADRSGGPGRRGAPTGAGRAGPRLLSRRCTSSSISCWVASEYCRLEMSCRRGRRGRRRRSRRDRAADSCRTPAPCGTRARG